MKTIAILALDEVVPFDLATATEVFGWTCKGDGSPAYQVQVCTQGGRVRAGAFDLLSRHRLEAALAADTLVVPGIRVPERPSPPRALAVLREAARAGKRIASICSGAFVLAEAGLLDGLRVTTHWLAAPILASRYPALRVDANVLFVDNGQILTSAGAAAGLDLCLHMVRNDYGAEVAARTARLSVMPLERPGGQAQFIEHVPPHCASSLQGLLPWLEENLAEPLRLEDMAQRAATSVRTLNRRFLEQVGMPPLQWLLKARVRHARRLLETTPLSVEQVATRAGFGSATALRERFMKDLGTSPSAYRRAFRAMV